MPRGNPVLFYLQAENCWCVKIAGQRYRLGPDRAKAQRERDRLVGEWLLGHRPRRPAAGGLGVAELLGAYLSHAEAYYAGSHGQLDRVKAALRAVEALYGGTLVSDFGSIALETVRAKMVAHGYARRTVNAMVACIRRAWKWAASREMIDASCWHRLQVVEGLRRGRTTARESAPIRPVEEWIVEATADALGGVVGDLLRLLLVTGMRPCEACALTPGAVDRTGPVWAYRVPDHANKMSHAGRTRVVFLGPLAQAILAPYLERGQGVICFSPREADRARRDRGHEARRSKPTPRQLAGRKAGLRGDRGVAYDRRSLYLAVRRGVRRANADRHPPLLLVPDFSPYRLRHTCATRVRELFGLDGAQHVLGHAHASTSEIYAEKSATLAARIAQRMG